MGFQPLIFTEEEELTDALKKLSPEELAKLKSALGTKVVVEPWNEGTKRDKVGGLSVVVVVVVAGGVFVFLLYDPPHQHVMIINTILTIIDFYCLFKCFPNQKVLIV